MECVPKCTAMLLVNQNHSAAWGVEVPCRTERVILGCMTDVPVITMLLLQYWNIDPAQHRRSTAHPWCTTGGRGEWIWWWCCGGRRRVRYHAVVSQYWTWGAPCRPECPCSTWWWSASHTPRSPEPPRQEDTKQLTPLLRETQPNNFVSRFDEGEQKCIDFWFN